MSRTIINNSRGFSLIDVLTSLTVFAVMMTGFATLLVGSLRATDNAQHMTIAANIAQDALENVRNSGSAACTSNDITHGALTYVMTCATANGPVSGTQEVTVTVAWTDLSAHSVSLKTLIVL